MKRKTPRSALIAAAALVLAFAASCGDTPGSPNVSAPWADLMPMQRVAPGTFTLGESLGTWNGDGGSNESNLTQVTLTQGFYMGRYPVTWGQWVAVMLWNPNGIPFLPSGWIPAPANQQEIDAGFDMSRRPATHVSWYDAIVFANRLSIMRGLTPAYELPDAYPSYTSWSSDPDTWGAVPTSLNNGRWNAARIASGNPTGYRLPTEAQWEFAAKGGVTGETFTFSGSNTVGDVAWTWENSEFGGIRSPRMVGLLDANGLGLHDMSGNVLEWVQDWYDAYPGTPQYDPVGAASGLFVRVLRGGSWGGGASHARSV